MSEKEHSTLHVVKEKEPKTLLAIDPGGTVGWAKLNIETAMPIEFGEEKIETEWGFEQWLNPHLPDAIVVEDYFIRPASMQRSKYAHSWDKGVALRQIGAVKYHCYQFDIPFALQQPSQKPMGYKIMGKEYVKGKAGQHKFDAIAHGVLYIAKVYGTVREGKV